MKSDEVFQYIGEFSRFQWLVMSLVCFCSVLTAVLDFSQLFLAPSVDHWCAVIEWTDDVDECWTSDKELYLECIHDLRDASIPLEEGSYPRCYKYDTVYPSDWYEGFSASNYTNVTTPCDDGWVYDRSVYPSSFIIDFDIVCERENLKEIEQSLFFAGYIVSNFIFGTISDRFGRFKAFYLSSLLTVIFGTIAAFSPTFWFFVLFRFLQSCSSKLYDLALIIGMEMAGPSKRVLAGTIMPLAFPLGYMVLVLLHILIPSNWRFFQLAVMAHYIIIFLFVFILPESIRWLISKKKYDEAERVILKIARMNKSTNKLPQNFMNEIKREAEMEEKNKKQKKNPYIQDLFRTTRLRHNYLILMYQWFVISLAYFGLSLSTSSLGSNDYISLSISGAVEIPAYLTCLFVMDSFLGRHGSLLVLEGLGGVACICTIFIPAGVWRTAVGMVGKFGIAASSTVSFIFTSELLPTPVRGIGISVCGTAAGIASSLSPLILVLSDYWEPLPYVIFGSTAVVGAFLQLLLPETRGKPLPETMKDGETIALANRTDYARVHTVNI